MTKDGKIKYGAIVPLIGGMIYKINFYVSLCI
jgi:hypothetical protein